MALKGTIPQEQLKAGSEQISWLHINQCHLLIPPDSTQSASRFPLIPPQARTPIPSQRAWEPRGPAELRSFKSSFYPLPLCSSRSRALGVIPSWHGIFHAKPDRSLLSNPACALLPGQRAQRSLHPATELSFSMSCLPRTRNLVAQAGRAHAAMLLTVF